MYLHIFIYLLVNFAVIPLSVKIKSKTFAHLFFTIRNFEFSNVVLCYMFHCFLNFL